MLTSFTLEYWIDEDWYVGKLKEVPGVFSQGESLEELLDAGCSLKRHGKKHDLYSNPKTGRQAPVPRYSEIKDSLVKLIRKQLEFRE